MKASSGLFVLLLIIWMGGSTYWYVCKIKEHCKCKSVSERKEILTNSITDSSTYPLESKQDTILQKEEIIKDIRNKISEGYTIYNFPKNSCENNTLEESFNSFAGDLKLYLKENPNEKIVIIGYTDSIGSEKGNFYFGKKRAEFIKTKLCEKGLDSGRMEIVSKGEKEPGFPNDNEGNRQKNRRVVIKLIQN
jgi:OmpA-OmpF porin, OOP family